jgi:hypothetical protein
LAICARAHRCLGNSDDYLKTYYKISTPTTLKFPKCIDKYLGNAKVAICKYSHILCNENVEIL